jgi:Uma2 family endonuclease
LPPLRLSEDLRLAPEQFERMIAMPLTASETGARNNEPLFKLTPLSKTTGTWNVFNSASGFLLPDGTVPSPDASLVSLER